MNTLHQPWFDATALRRDIPDPTSTERVQHMVETLDRLHEISPRFTQVELRTEVLPQSVGCRCFGISGKAAATTSAAFQQAHLAVYWQRWTRYGQRLLRDYSWVNYKLLWQRWQPENLSLRQQLLRILAQEGAATSV